MINKSFPYKGKISFILVMNKEKFTNDGGRERNDDLF
jgi:hypothetical protein